MRRKPRYPIRFVLIGLMLGLLLLPGCQKAAWLFVHPGPIVETHTQLLYSSRIVEYIDDGKYAEARDFSMSFLEGQILVLDELTEKNRCIDREQSPLGLLKRIQKHHLESKSTGEKVPLDPQVEEALKRLIDKFSPECGEARG